MALDNILTALPEVRAPIQKLSFKPRLIWTLIILFAFFLLSVIPLYGLGVNELARLEQLSVILGASFGSIMSLGIGPIVTASIVLQLLTGSGLLNMNQTTREGRVLYQGLQKWLTLFFIVFESCVYVFMGGLQPNAALQGTSAYFSYQLILIGQLVLGGILVVYMDEITHKWGLGSGVSLFIAANVAQEIVIRSLSPLNTVGQIAFGSGQPPVGAVLVFLMSLVGGDPQGAMIALAAILATLVVFAFCVYAQAMKVEIPLSFGKVRGYGIRWPLNFLYTSNIPVILMAALIANIELFARLLEKWGLPLLGTFAGNSPASGLVLWIAHPQLMTKILTGSISFPSWWSNDITHSLAYVLILMIGSLIFSVFWVQTAGMSASSQAKNILASGLQIQGFRRDQRVLESVLDRYIFPLTVMGGLTIGALAATADLLGALSRGTGILLAVMIIYRLYQDIAKHYMMDMNPAMRKMMGGGED